MKLVNADSIEKRNIGQHFKILTIEPLPAAPDVDASAPPAQNRTVQKRDLNPDQSLVGKAVRADAPQLEKHRSDTFLVSDDRSHVIN
jgi:hypothetical protein